TYGEFDWANGATIPTVTNDGYSVTFTPNQHTIDNYETITTLTGTVAIIVNQAIPNPPAPPTVSDIIVGQTLADALPFIGGSTNGTWAWDNDAIVPSVGSSDHDAIFTPTDTTNYNWTGITLTFSISVNATSGPIPPTISTHPANATVTVGTAANFTVTAGGTAPLTYQWEVATNGDNWTVVSGGTGGTTYSYTTAATTTTMNSYRYRVIVSGSGSEVTSDIATLTVNRMTPTVNWPTGLTAVYGQTLNDVALPPDNGSGTLGTFAWNNPNPTTTSVGTVAGPNNFSVTFTPTNTDFDTATSNVQINVTRRPITITPNTGQTKVFGTADPTFTYTPSESLLAGNSFSGALGRVANENVGTYAFTLGTLSAGNNYTLSLGGAYTFEITRATISGTERTVAFTQGVAANQNFDLNTLAPGVSNWGTSGPTFAVGAITDTDNILASTPSPVASTLNISVRNTAQAGQTATIPITITSGNYTNINVNINVTIDAKTQVTISGITTSSKVFDGVSFAPTGTVSAGAVDVSTLVWLYESTDGGGYSSATPPTNAGAYTLTISLPDTNPTHFANPLEMTFSITPRPITLVATDQILAYHADMPELTFTITNLATGHGVADALSVMPVLEPPEFDNRIAGTYPIVLTGGTATANYNIVDRVNGVLTVEAPSFIEEPEPITETATDAVFAIRSVFVHLHATSLNGNTLNHTVANGGTKILLSGYPGFDGYIGEAVSGSTIITFYKEFLDFLPNGTHTLMVAFHDGVAAEPYATPTTSFVINRAVTGGGGGDNIVNYTPDDRSTRSTQTGDYSNTVIWQAILVTSVFGIVLAVAWMARREIKYKWELLVDDLKRRN
ncbi:MAG: hypothetical protein FWE83_05830, partial [Oscillospiraceae bacterium]|nr:hypothetical protein [Oscillospiraceae bacterium]